MLTETSSIRGGTTSGILLIKEEEEAFESADESEKEALTIFHEKLGLSHITPDNIEAAYRVGEKQKCHFSPIIVKFVSRKTKAEIIKNRRKLKGS